MIIRLVLIFIFMALQSCSNTTIGEKLENSFDNVDPKTISDKNSNQQIYPDKKKQTKLIKKSKDKKVGKVEVELNNIKTNSLSNKDSLSQKSSKSINKVVFNPQPYRIILRLSGANPSAPAETVTNALRKAGVQFEVEKIERFDGENTLKNTSLKR